MRVTGIMKEYITEEVRKRIEPKYEDKKQAKKTRDDIRDNFIDTLNDILNKQLNDAIDEFLAKNKEYIDNRSHTWGNTVSLNYSLVGIEKDDIENWRKDMEKEVLEKVKEIVVTLELGGTKKDLDELLNNI